MKWVKIFAYGSLILAVLTLLLDLFTRHFSLLLNDAISILLLIVIIWAMNKLLKSRR